MLRQTNRLIRQCNITTRRCAAFHSFAICSTSADRWDTLRVSPQYFRNNENNEQKRNNDKKSRNYKYTGYALALSYWATLKHFTGIEEIKLDKDESVIYRRYHKYDEAASELHEALNILNNEQPPRKEKAMAITRVYDELANVYFESGQYDEAKRLFIEVTTRILTLHGGTERDAAIIGISLKVARMMELQGDRANADMGYKFCLEKQREVTGDHLAQTFSLKGRTFGYYPSHGSVEQVRAGGYTDPLALLGMCQESYAHFLTKTPGRAYESMVLFNQASQIVNELFGMISEQAVVMYNNFGVQWLFANKFDIAAYYLGEAVRRGEQVPACASRMPGFYCNYAEALFHSGRQKEAFDNVQKAGDIAKKTKDDTLAKYVQEFKKEMQSGALRHDNKTMKK